MEGLDTFVPEGAVLRPLLSIIVPIYGVEEYLPACLDSILEQTFKDFEVILVDDGSKDNCPSICDEYASKDPRINVIHKENGGLVAARRTGNHASTGVYLMHVDGDDSLCPGALQSIVEKGIKRGAPDLVIFGRNEVYEDHTDSILPGFCAGRYDRKRIEEEIFPNQIYDSRKPFFNIGVVSVIWDKAYKRELLLAHECRDDSFTLFEDTCCTIETVRAADSIVILHETLYNYDKRNRTSMTSGYRPDYLDRVNRALRYISDGVMKEARSEAEKKDLKHQLAFFALSRIMIGVFQEVRFNHPVKEAEEYIRRVIKETDILSLCPEEEMKTAPKLLGLFLRLLQKEHYRTALFLAKWKIRILG